MDAAKIKQKNDELTAKIAKRDREKMKLRPLDKNYGQRYFMYDRSMSNLCSKCTLPATLHVNGIPVCNDHIGTV